jgi:peptidoglycan hydrolase-like protein with peptidoglycan-binding domain
MANWQVVESGSTGENVRTAQYLLNENGASVAVDGDFGVATKAAVEAFQAAHGLTADGVVGDETWPALIVTVRPGATGDAVKAAQSQIVARAPGLLAVDGVYGTATEAAVNAFKAAVGLPPNGAVGPNPWNAFVEGFLTAASAGEANEAVFAAWTRADPDAAKRNATPAAVEELFAQTWHPDVWTFAGSGAAAGSVYSTWKSAGTELVLRANDGTGTPFNYTTSATF